MKYSNPLPVLTRAALGGVIVGLVMLIASVIRYKLTLGYVPYAYLFIVPGLPMALGVGAVGGALIGMSVWVLTVIRGRTYGIIGRAIIGVVSALVIVTLYAFLHTDEPGYDRPTYSWTEHAVFWFVSGLVVGLLPGILARDKSSTLTTHQ